MRQSSGTALPALGFLGWSILFVSAIMLVLAVPLVARAAAPGFILLAFLSGGALLVHRRTWPRPPWSLLAPLAAFILYGAISSSWSLAPEDARAQSVTFLYEFLPAFLLFASLSLLEPRAAERITAILPWLALVGLMLLAVEVLADSPIQQLFGNPQEPVDLVRPANRSALLTAFISAPVALALRQQGRIMLSGLWMLVVLVVCALSDSQSALVAQGAIIILWALARRWPRAVTIAIGLGIIAGLVLCQPVVLLMYEGGLAQAGWMPDSFSHRIMTWDFILPHLGEKPWLGWGLDSSRAIPGGHETFPGTDHWAKLPLHPHNFFLQVRLELGWVGAVLVGWLLLAVLARLQHLPPPVRPAALALFGGCVLAQCFAYGAWQTWLLCGMMFAFFLLALTGRALAANPPPS